MSQGWEGCNIAMPSTSSSSPSASPHLLIFGLGYTGAAIAEAASGAGFAVSATVRRAAQPPARVSFESAAPLLATATHLLSTVPPSPDGDPVLRRHADAIAAAPMLRWIGYLSSTVVYGDRGGGWVDEDTPPAPTQDRGRQRLDAETGWRGFAGSRAVDIFRLAGIYGPGRSPFDSLRSGRAHCVLKPGHAFGRIHRDDIAGAALAAMRQDGGPGCRVLNLNDDEPAETATVLAVAARLLDMAPPRGVPFAEAEAAMSPMARSFWAENRKVASRKTQAALGYAWRHPTYREGLRAILREESAQRPA